MQKYLEKLGLTKRRAMLLVMSVCMSAMMAAPAFAVDPSFDLSATMTTSVNKIVTDLLGMIGAVLPVMITLFAASIGITYAIKFVRRILGKA